MEHISTFFREEKDPFFQKGVKKGIQKGVEQNSHKIVRNLITQLGLTDEQTASVAEVSVEFVREIRASLAEE